MEHISLYIMIVIMYSGLNTVIGLLLGSAKEILAPKVFRLTSLMFILYSSMFFLCCMELEKSKLIVLSIFGLLSGLFSYLYMRKFVRN